MIFSSKQCGGCGLVWSADWSYGPCEKCGTENWQPVDNPVDSLANPQVAPTESDITYVEDERVPPGTAYLMPAGHDPWEGSAIPDMIPPPEPVVLETFYRYGFDGSIQLAFRAERCPVIHPDGVQCPFDALSSWTSHDHPDGSRYPSPPAPDLTALVHPFTD